MLVTEFTGIGELTVYSHVLITELVIREIRCTYICVCVKEWLGPVYRDVRERRISVITRLKSVALGRFGVVSGIVVEMLKGRMEAEKEFRLESQNEPHSYKKKKRTIGGSSIQFSDNIQQLFMH